MLLWQYPYDLYFSISDCFCYIAGEGQSSPKFARLLLSFPYFSLAMTGNKSTKLLSQIAQVIAFFENHYLHEIFLGRKLLTERNSFTMKEKKSIFNASFEVYKVPQKQSEWSLWFQIHALAVDWFLWKKTKGRAK